MIEFAQMLLNMNRYANMSHIFSCICEILSFFSMICKILIFILTLFGSAQVFWSFCHMLKQIWNFVKNVISRESMWAEQSSNCRHCYDGHIYQILHIWFQIPECLSCKIMWFISILILTENSSSIQFSLSVWIPGKLLGWVF